MRRPAKTWLFDLDNTLHQATPHIFPHINRSMTEYIERHLGVDSLAYLSKAGMVEAAQTQSGHFCTACFDGNYPIEMDESVRSSKLMLEPAGLAAVR